MVLTSYQQMLKNKEKAFELRRQKKSYRLISTELGISKSTLASWFRSEPWSREIRDELGQINSLAFPEKLGKIVAANKKRWAQMHQKYRDEAVSQFPNMKSDPLFLAGIMLYWGEGEKSIKSPHVKIANSDPSMIRIFYLFLKESLGIPDEKIRIYLLLYPDLVEKVQKNFWSRATGIHIDKFNKSIYIASKHPTKRLSYGVGNITFSSREFKEKILKWIELYQYYFSAHELLKKN